MDKIIVMGYRAGSSLMSVILKEGFGLKMWYYESNKGNITESSIGTGINFCNPPMEWEFGKHPALCAYLNILDDRFSPFYIWMKRDIESKLTSAMQLGVNLKNGYYKYPWMQQKISRYSGIPYHEISNISREKANRLWIEWEENTIQSHFNNNKSRYMIVDFDEFMTEKGYWKILDKISKLVNKPYDRETLNNIRNNRHGAKGLHSIEYWKKQREDELDG